MSNGFAQFTCTCITCIKISGFLFFFFAVETLQKECKHIELSQIPRTVVSLFQSLSAAPVRECNSTTTATSGVTTEWKGVPSKLSSSLMQFQREGVK